MVSIKSWADLQLSMKSWFCKYDYTGQLWLLDYKYVGILCDDTNLFRIAFVEAIEAFAIQTLLQFASKVSENIKYYLDWCGEGDEYLSYNDGSNMMFSESKDTIK